MAVATVSHADGPQRQRFSVPPLLSKMVMIGLRGLSLYNVLAVNCSVWKSLRPRLLPRCILLTLLPNMTMIISRHGKLTVKSRKTHSDDPCLVHI